MKFCAGWMFLAAMMFFLPTAPFTVQEADSAQFLALGSECLRSGWPLAHPPGYPIHTGFSCLSALIAKSSMIPAALMLAWISAIFAAMAAAVAFQFTGGIAGTIAVAVVFLSRDVWRTATLQEPFGLAMLTFVVAMLVPARGTGRLAWLATGIAFGLALANHHTTAIVLPATLWLLWQRRDPKDAAMFAAGATAGALPALLVLAKALAPEPFPYISAGEPGLAFDWSRFLVDGTAVPSTLRYLLRIDFGTFAMATHPASSTMPLIPPAFMLFVESLPENIGWTGVLLVVTGFFSMVRDWRANLHWFLTLGTATVFVLLIRLPVNDNIVDVIRRQLAIPLIALIPFIHAGLQTLATAPLRKGRRKNNSKNWQRATFTLAALLTTSHVAMQFPQIRRDQRNFPEWHFKSSLSGLPPGALVITASDDHIFGFSYAQASLGVRPDVRILNLLEWGTPRQRSLSLARTGITPDEDLIALNRGQLLRTLASREPVWIIDPPQKPWPDYLARATCRGPFLVLDLQEGVPQNPPEWKQVAYQKRTSELWLAWDRMMLRQHEDCGADKSQPATP